MSLPPRANKWYDAWFKKLPSLKDKVVAITGTTSGLGHAAAVYAIKKNCTALFVLNRTSQRAEDEVAELLKVKAQVVSDTVVKHVPCDLMSFESVRAAAVDLSKLCEQYGRLDVLVNNAGISLFPDERTKDGYDVQIQVNHLSHFLLTKLMMPLLVESAEARVVNHTSNARNQFGELDASYFRKCAPDSLGGKVLKATFTRYQQSKLANTIFTEALADKLNKKNISDVKSVCGDPGLSNSDLGVNLRKANTQPSWSVWLFNKALDLFSYLSFAVPNQSGEDGVLSLVYAAFGPDEEIRNGDLFVPEFTFNGPPVRIIHEFKEIHSKKGVNEKKTLDQNAWQLLWDLSENAVGESFLADVKPEHQRPIIASKSNL